MNYSEWIKLKEEDVKNNPEKHLHTYNELLNCCMFNGALDSKAIDLHSQYVDLGSNGGTDCDTIEGPCACGAWHKKEEKIEYIKKIKKEKIVEENKYKNKFEMLDI